MRAQPTDSLASGQSAAKQRYMDKLLQIEADCRKRADRVENGAGRGDTLGGFERADELSRDLAEEARRLFLPEEQIEQIKADRVAMQQIRLYYTGVELDQPSLVGPTRDTEPNGD